MTPAPTTSTPAIKSARRMDSALRTASRSRQVVSQNYSSGHVVQRFSLPQRRVCARFGCAGQLLSFPTAEPLVDQLDHQPKLLAQPLGKLFSLSGHFARRAIETDRPAHDDFAHGVLAANFAKPLYVVAAVRTLQDLQRPRG